MKLLLFMLVCLVSIPFESEPTKMQWNAQRQLTWEDFQGVPNLGADYVASTNSGISFSFSYQVSDGVMTMQYEVLSNFYPELSWFKPTKVSEYILKHEQTHFDITELFARKLRKAMAETSFSNKPKQEVNAIYEQIERARRKFQNQYDRETEHSKNKSAEMQWRNLVAQELQKYDRWKS
jgi:hypothetical protein